MRLRPALSAAVLGALTAGTAFAQDAGMRQLGAHVHGAAELIAAADPDGLVVAELSSPAWNFYGFEGAAAAGQAAQVAAVNTRLAEPGLVDFAGAAGCRLGETALIGAPEAGADSHDHDHHHGDHDHAGHDHDHGDHHDHEAAHDHTDHHDHDEHGDHDHHGDHAHSDVVVNWSFQCDRPDRLGGLDLSGLFAAFERLERVEVQYLDADTAAARQLTPADPVLALD